MRTRPGLSGSLPATGWSSRSPKRRANATCSAREMSWSRKNRTLWRIHSSWISPRSASSCTASARLTFEISAPMAQVSGSTRIESRMAPGRTMAGAAVDCVVIGFLLLLLPASNDEDRRARGLARLEVAVRLHGILQRVVLVHLDADAARGDVPEELLGERGLFPEIGDVVGERGTREIERALHRELHGVDR